MSDFPRDFNDWSHNDKTAYYGHLKEMAHADVRKAEAEAEAVSRKAEAEAEARKADARKAEAVTRTAQTTGEFFLLDNIL